MLRAGTGQEAIDVDEAIQYLKASQFISGKAIDIYKNYQVCHASIREEFCSSSLWFIIHLCVVSLYLTLFGLVIHSFLVGYWLLP